MFSTRRNGFPLKKYDSIIAVYCSVEGCGRKSLESEHKKHFGSSVFKRILEF